MNDRLSEMRLRLQRAREAAKSTTPAQLDPEEVLKLINSNRPSTDGPAVGVMANHYLSVTETSWAGPEVRRVVNKLEAASLLIFADRFGMLVANMTTVPYTLVGPHEIPCHPQSNWNGSTDFRDMSIGFIKSSASDLITVTHLASAEAHAAARLHVAQTCDILVLVAGAKGFREWVDRVNDLVHIDKHKQETNRYARSTS